MHFARFTVLAVCGLLLAWALLAGWWRWTGNAHRQAAMTRGNTLNSSLRRYQRQHQQLPATDNWRALTAIGFTSAELDGAYPQYTKVSSTVYQLVFAQGYDGPYLMWDSGERRWKDGQPAAVVKQDQGQP